METSTLADRVYEVLREGILQGTYAPGQKLNLAELARDLRVSNTPIREAMARLERMRLVEMVPYCGPKVKRLTPKELADLYDVRIALEALAVRLVVRRQDPEVLTEMAEALEKQDIACTQGDPQGVIDADRAFHDGLVRASGNSALLEMLPMLSDRTRLLLELNTPAFGELDRDAALQGLEGHRQIHEALLRGDPEAATQELRRELIRGKERILQRTHAGAHGPQPEV